MIMWAPIVRSGRTERILVHRMRSTRRDCEREFNAGVWAGQPVRFAKVRIEEVASAGHRATRTPNR